jgi:hypothetical protein
MGSLQVNTALAGSFRNHTIANWKNCIGSQNILPNRRYVKERGVESRPLTSYEYSPNGLDVVTVFHSLDFSLNTAQFSSLDTAVAMGSTTEGSEFESR